MATQTKRITGWLCRELDGCVTLWPDPRLMPTTENQDAWLVPSFYHWGAKAFRTLDDQGIKLPRKGRKVRCTLALAVDERAG